MSDDYPYCSWGQPYTAYIGLIGCGLLIIFNGFDIFIFKPFRESDFFAAYLAVFVFVAIYGIAKFMSGRPIVATSMMSYSVHREDFDRRRVSRNVGRIRGFLSWVFG
jgi:amino acid transporter